MSIWSWVNKPLVKESELIRHAKTELEVSGYFKDNDPLNNMAANDIMELIRVFAKQRHSGFSAHWILNEFTKLAKYQPLAPLTGEDAEWNEYEPGEFQNKRCSHVFKKNGQAYDIDAYSFEDENGSWFTNSKSSKDITFPYTPHKEYVKYKAPEAELAK